MTPEEHEEERIRLHGLLDDVVTSLCMHMGTENMAGTTESGIVYGFGEAMNDKEGAEMMSFAFDELEEAARPLVEYLRDNTEYGTMATIEPRLGCYEISLKIGKVATHIITDDDEFHRKGEK